MTATGEHLDGIHRGRDDGIGPRSVSVTRGDDHERCCRRRTSTLGKIDSGVVPFGSGTRFKAQGETKSKMNLVREMGHSHAATTGES